MNNPWKKIPESKPFILPEDLEFINRHNKNIRDDNYKILTHLLPDPFMGRKDAPVILLNLNPGYNGTEDKLHTRKDFIEMCKANLFHNQSDYPLYYFNLELRKTQGYIWWKKHAGCSNGIITYVGEKSFVENTLVTEYFPYHSRKFNFKFKEKLPSQQYTKYLVENGINQGAIFIIMRAKREWEFLVPMLKTYDYVYTLKNPQGGWLSKNNIIGDFDLIIDKYKYCN